MPEEREVKHGQTEGGNVSRNGACSSQCALPTDSYSTAGSRALARLRSERPVPQEGAERFASTTAVEGNVHGQQRQLVPLLNPTTWENTERVGRPRSVWKGYPLLLLGSIDELLFEPVRKAVRKASASTA